MGTRGDEAKVCIHAVMDETIRRVRNIESTGNLLAGGRPV